MFSIRTFLRAEKEMGSLGKTHGLVPGKHNCGAVGRNKEERVRIGRYKVQKTPCSSQYPSQ